MALSLLTKPSPSRALLIARLHHASPVSMGFARSPVGPLELPQVGYHSLSFNGVVEHCVVVRGGTMFFHVPPLRAVHSTAGSGNPLRKPSSVQVLGFTDTLRTSLYRDGCNSHSRGSKQRCFCSSSGPMNGPSQRNVENAGPVNNSYTQQGSNTPNRTYSYQQQQPPPPPPSHPATQQQQHPTYPASNNQQPGNQWPQQPRHAPGAPPAGTYAAGNTQQPGYAPPGEKVGSTENLNPQQAGYAPPPSMPLTGPGPAAPRTSAAAEVIDKYLGPSNLKLEKRDDRVPPPPPPRRNYGPQGTQEKKSGKDLVAESAACAVIEKYLGPWPGFPPRDPKIDEYLDSLPENAACAAIDKYFGPYKPLFVFKKNEGDANNPPPPNRPPRNRMMSRARNRAWNASQQGASVDRPWTPPQQGSSVDAMQGGHPPQSAASPPSLGAASTQGFGAIPSQQVASTMPSQPDVMPTQMASQQGASKVPPPHGAGFSPPSSNSS